METGTYRKIENDLSEAYLIEAKMENDYNNNVVASCHSEESHMETIAEADVHEGKKLPKLFSEKTGELDVEIKRSNDSSAKLVSEYLQDSNNKNVNEGKIIAGSVKKIKDHVVKDDDIEAKTQTTNGDVTTANNEKAEGIYSDTEEEAQSLISHYSYITSLDTDSEDMQSFDIQGVKISDESSSDDDKSISERSVKNGNEYYKNKDNALKISNENTTRIECICMSDKNVEQASVTDVDHKTNTDNVSKPNIKPFVTLKEFFTVDNRSKEENIESVEVNNDNIPNTSDITADHDNNVETEEKLFVGNNNVKNEKEHAVENSVVKNGDKTAVKSSVFSNIVQRLFSKVSGDSNSHVQSASSDADDCKSLEEPIIEDASSAINEITVDNNIEVQIVIDGNVNNPVTVENCNADPQEVFNSNEVTQTPILSDDSVTNPALILNVIADESENHESVEPSLSDDNVDKENIKESLVGEDSNFELLIVHKAVDVTIENTHIVKEEDAGCDNKEYSANDSDENVADFNDKKLATFSRYVFKDDKAGQVTDGKDIKEVVNTSEGGVEITEDNTYICNNSPIVCEDSEKPDENVVLTITPVVTAINNSIQSESITLNIKIIVQTDAEGSGNVHTEAFSRMVAMKKTVCSVCTCVNNDTIESNTESIDRIVVDEAKITTENVTNDSEDATNVCAKSKKGKLQKKKNKTNLFQFFKP